MNNKNNSGGGGGGAPSNWKPSTGGGGGGGGGSGGKGSGGRGGGSGGKGSGGSDKSSEEEDVLEAYEAQVDVLEHEIDLLENQRELVEKGSVAWNKNLAEAIIYQEKIKTLSHEQAEALRKLPDGAQKYAEEIRQLSDNWWAADKAVREYKKDLIDSTYEQKKMLLEYKQAVSEANLAGMIEGREDWIIEVQSQIALLKQFKEIEEERIEQYKEMNPSLYMEEIIDSAKEVLDYQKEMLDLAQDLADAYASVPDLVEDIITFEEIKPLEKQKEYLEEYKDFIDKGFDIEQNYNDALKANNPELAEAYKKQLDYIEEVKSKLEGVNDADEKNRILKEAQLKLQEMNIDALKEELNLVKGERNKRVYHADKGWIWEADSSQAAEKEQEIKDAELELEIDRIESEIEARKDYIDKWHEVVEEQEIAEKKLTLESLLGH